MKHLLLILSIVSCGPPPTEAEDPEAAKTKSWSAGFARQNAELSCQTHFYSGNSSLTQGNPQPCKCVRETIESRWTYDDFKAHEYSYLEALKSDGTAARCGIPGT